jgi:hypothetical protein
MEVPFWTLVILLNAKGERLLLVSYFWINNPMNKSERIELLKKIELQKSLF